MNQNNNYQSERESQTKESKNITVSFTFSLLFIITILTYINSKYTSVDKADFSLSLWPVINKFQFYRIITRYFLYYGIFHLLVNMFFLYFICRALEKLIGTIYAIAFISQTLILSSVIYLILMFLLKNVTRLLSYNSNINFKNEVGISPLIFSIYTYYFLFGKNLDKKINILFFLEIPSRFSPFFFMLFLYTFTPNTTIFGHFSGILSGYLIKHFLGKYTMPKNIWIKELEERWSFCKKEIFYISILDKNDDFIQTIQEIEKNYFDLLHEEKNEAEINNSGRAGREMDDFPEGEEQKENNNENNNHNNNIIINH